MSHGLVLGGAGGGATRQTLDHMKLRGQRSRESEGAGAERLREASPPPGVLLLEELQPSRLKD